MENADVLFAQIHEACDRVAQLLRIIDRLEVRLAEITRRLVPDSETTPQGPRSAP